MQSFFCFSFLPSTWCLPAFQNAKTPLHVRFIYFPWRFMLPLTWAEFLCNGRQKQCYTMSKDPKRTMSDIMRTDTTDLERYKIIHMTISFSSQLSLPSTPKTEIFIVWCHFHCHSVDVYLFFTHIFHSFRFFISFNFLLFLSFPKKITSENSKLNKITLNYKIAIKDADVLIKSIKQDGSESKKPRNELKAVKP